MCPLSTEPWALFGSRGAPRLRLARVLEDRGAFAEAEPLRRRGLEAEERLLGPEHRVTLTAVHNLAFVLKRLGKFREAPLMCCAAVHRGGWMVLPFVLGKAWKQLQGNNQRIFRSSQNFVIYVEVR